MKKYLRHPVVKNALALYSVQFAEYLLPMITIPYLARILHPDGWGKVVYAQNFSMWIVLVLEYGFGFSASREIARHRDNPQRHAEFASGVLGGNLLLMVPAAILVVVARFTAPQFREDPSYLWLAAGVAVVAAFRPFWYFQGIEKMTFPAWTNVLGRFLYAAGIFLFIHSQGSAWLVLGLQGISGIAITAILLGSMYRQIPFQPPSLANALPALKAGWTIFLSRSATSLYTLANTFILGLFVAPAAVAYYGGAERVVLAVIGLMTPFTQALYPRMSHLAVSDQGKAASALSMGLRVFTLIGVVVGAIVFASAPLVVRILLGKAYAPAAGILRVAALIIPLVAVSNILGMQWMLASGMDRVFSRISLVAGVLNVFLATFLSWKFGAIGTAWSIVAAQGFVTFTMVVLYFRSKPGLAS